MESLIPGLIAELKNRGAKSYDPGLGLRMYDLGAPCPRGITTGVEVMAASRRLINEVLQDLLLAQGGDRLVFRDRTKVSNLIWEESETEHNSNYMNKSKMPKKGNSEKPLKGIRGVILDSEEEMTADVVFICNGRRSQLPHWLKEKGIELPEELKVDCKLSYASRWMKLPIEFNPEKECYAVVVSGRPTLARGGVFQALENGFAQFCMTGFEGEKAPLDHEGWMKYAASLPDQSIHDIAARCEPLGPITRFASIPNIHRQYQKATLPQGLVVLGDAAMILNPAYGQGMSQAAQAAAALDQHLETVVLKGKTTKEERVNALRSMGLQLHGKLNQVCAGAWQLATSEDMRWKGVEVSNGIVSTPKWMYKYLDAVLTVCQNDPTAWVQMVRVAQCIDPPTVLFAPRMAMKALKFLIFGKKKNEKEVENSETKGVKGDIVKENGVAVRGG